jgi:hypothetical protein
LRHHTGQARASEGDEEDREAGKNTQRTHYYISLDRLWSDQYRMRIELMLAGHMPVNGDVKGSWFLLSAGLGFRGLHTRIYTRREERLHQKMSINI